MVDKPKLAEYVSRLQHWRDRYERYLDARPRVQSLDLISHWLMEFQFVKLDEIDVPGQYLEVRSNQCGHRRDAKCLRQYSLSTDPSNLVVSGDLDPSLRSAVVKATASSVSSYMAMTASNLTSLCSSQWQDGSGEKIELCSSSGHSTCEGLGAWSSQACNDIFI